MGKPHGPAITLLAERLGEPPDVVASDPRVLARALRLFGKDAVDLLRAYASNDPAEREAAERQWAALAARFPESEAKAGADAFRARLERILGDAVVRLEELVREVAPETAARNRGAMATEQQETEAAFVARDGGSEVLDAVAAIRRLGPFDVEPRPTLALTDRYFDTKDRALAARRIVLRVRESDGDVLLAVKGKGGDAAGGGTRRLEIEERWSHDALRSALARLADAGVRVGEPDRAPASPREALEAAALELVQERETERRVRDVVQGGSTLAEIDVDAVTYRLRGGQARLFEVEVESKQRAFELGPVLDELLREVPGLEPWPYSKFATGVALERALAEGTMQLDRDGVVRPESFDVLASRLGEA